MAVKQLADSWKEYADNLQVTNGKTAREATEEEKREFLDNLVSTDELLVENK